VPWKGELEALRLVEKVEYFPLCCHTLAPTLARYMKASLHADQAIAGIVLVPARTCLSSIPALAGAQLARPQAHTASAGYTAAGPSAWLGLMPCSLHPGIPAHIVVFVTTSPNDELMSRMAKGRVPEAGSQPGHRTCSKQHAHTSLYAEVSAWTKSKTCIHTCTLGSGLQSHFV